MKLNRHQPQLLRLPLKSDLLPAFSRLSGHRNTSLLIARIDHATVVVHRFAQAMPPTTVQSFTRTHATFPDVMSSPTHDSVRSRASAFENLGAESEHGI